MKINLRIIVILTMAFFLVVGCAATPTVYEPNEIEVNLSQYNDVQVVVGASDQIRQKKGYDATSALLLKEFVANVKAMGKYRIVDSESIYGQVLEVRLNITNFNYVHGAARGMFGILGGRAILYVTMSLKDKETASELSVVVAKHTSSHAQGIMSPTTSRQVTAITKELALKLQDTR